MCLGLRELDVAYVHGCVADFPDIDPRKLMLLRDAISLGEAPSAAV